MAACGVLQASRKLLCSPNARFQMALASCCRAQSTFSAGKISLDCSKITGFVGPVRHPTYLEGLVETSNDRHAIDSRSLGAGGSVICFALTLVLLLSLAFTSSVASVPRPRCADETDVEGSLDRLIEESAFMFVATLASTDGVNITYELNPPALKGNPPATGHLMIWCYGEVAADSDVILVWGDIAGDPEPNVVRAEGILRLYSGKWSRAWSQRGIDWIQMRINETPEN